VAGQHEDWKLSGGSGLEFAEGRRLRDQFRPQVGASGVVQLLGQHRERLGPHLDFDAAPAIGPPTRPSFARNSSMIAVLMALARSAAKVAMSQLIP
jgi:hypothetical protein